MQWKINYEKGLICFAKKDFSEALTHFYESAKSGGGGELCVLKAIGNTLFRMQAYALANLYFRKYLSQNIYDVDVAASYIIVNIYKNNENEVLQIFTSFVKVYDKQLFVKLVSKVISYFYRHKESATNKIMANLLYDIKLEKVSNNKDTCYIFIQPLLGKEHLFFHKKCECDRIFIKQNFIYAYFMPFHEELLRNIFLELTKLNIKFITLLSTSAGGFFSLLLGHEIARRFPQYHVSVHAFSPQTKINENDNLMYVTHYRDYKKIIQTVKMLRVESDKYSDIAKIYGDKLENLNANVYVGENAIVDINEVNRIIKCNNIHINVLNKFPYHDTLSMYRYNLSKIISIMPKFRPLTLGNGDAQKIEFSVTDCCKLKNSLTKNLNSILPFID